MIESFFGIKTLKDFKVSGNKVLVRCDFNVPLSETGEILDDFRIKKTIPTIEYLKNRDANLGLVSACVGGGMGGAIIIERK